MFSQATYHSPNKEKQDRDKRSFLIFFLAGVQNLLPDGPKGKSDEVTYQISRHNKAKATRQSRVQEAKQQSLGNLNQALSPHLVMLANC